MLARTKVVDVKADAPMLEVYRAVQAVNISGDFQRAIPLTTKRNFDSFLFLTPGIVSQDLGPSGYSSCPAAPRSTLTSSSWMARTLATRLPGYTILLNMSNDLLEDVRVKTGGMDAASPIAEGAVMSMVSKSGTNQLRDPSTKPSSARSGAAYSARRHDVGVHL